MFHKSEGKIFNKGIAWRSYVNFACIKKNSFPELASCNLLTVFKTFVKNYAEFKKAIKPTRGNNRKTDSRAQNQNIEFKRCFQM